MSLAESSLRNAVLQNNVISLAEWTEVWAGGKKIGGQAGVALTRIERGWANLNWNGQHRF